MVQARYCGRGVLFCSRWFSGVWMKKPAPFFWFFPIIRCLVANYGCRSTEPIRIRAQYVPTMFWFEQLFVRAHFCSVSSQWSTISSLLFYWYRNISTCGHFLLRYFLMYAIGSHPIRNKLSHDSYFCWMLDRFLLFSINCPRNCNVFL